MTDPIPNPEPEPAPAPDSEPASAYQTIIDSQNAQIAALIKQNNKLTSQITQMVQSGTQIAQAGQPTPAPNPEPSPIGGYGFAKGLEAFGDADDLSVSYLGNLIGKR
jgi:hypothetical protein